MTDEEKYIFDLQGFLKLESVLSPAEVSAMQNDMAEHGIANPDNNPQKSRFQFLDWGDRWRNLIDHERLLPCLNAIIGERFRLDHIYGMAASKDGESGQFGLHHESHMFGHGCYSHFEKGRMHNGLIVVSFALSDTTEGGGGFICIPGSHKANFNTPKPFYSAENNPLVVNVPVKAGDVIIFTESLTHGTAQWTLEHERRAALLKYCPHYMNWSKGAINAEAIDGLTDRQKLILEGGYVWQREAVV
ncbi:MAG: phytanoyl-CoA dioxygenase family protein [Verrucomicrobia bacterium]|nr:phytanoyl-CoA dioxygenase family protein [Verrucomicrobiota bacterium]